ncbi:MAG TPA: hypothetical protein VD999_04805 [Vitreimonas sp.]|nr:hypothetical protein [Vitreimonas sp.]
MPSFHDLANLFVNFNLDGIKVELPYFISDGNRTYYWRSEGKGSLITLQREIKAYLAQTQQELTSIKRADLKTKLQQARIGLDCSGYIYQLLDMYWQEQYGYSIKRHLLRYPGWQGQLEKMILSFRRERKISAHTLTNALNTFPIEQTKDIKVGDLLRLTAEEWHGKHVALVTTVTPSTITYTHSGLLTEKNGPHFATIKIVKPSAGLEKQHWQEKYHDGRNYGYYAYRLENGDGVRRLKYWPEL